MKARVRLGILLPMEGSKQEIAAHKALTEFQQVFGEGGGTWFATETGRPVVRGWWDDPAVSKRRNRKLSKGGDEDAAWQQFPLVRDKHLFVAIDVDAETTTVEETLDDMIEIFRKYYRGRSVAQKVVYISRQELLVRELSGKSSE